MARGDADRIREAGRKRSLAGGEVRLYLAPRAMERSRRIDRPNREPVRRSLRLIRR